MDYSLFLVIEHVKETENQTFVAQKWSDHIENSSVFTINENFEEDDYGRETPLENHFEELPILNFEENRQSYNFLSVMTDYQSNSQTRNVFGSGLRRLKLMKNNSSSNSKSL